ncbi:hypothetical protein BaRGS_00006555 [Batillaria attramentaria]|uniref:Uncharacterized protein n=1 Tax=Batillaria attramentaria TaxID=370345 RepID=A0ABD0LSP2_9CAEN
MHLVLQSGDKYMMGSLGGVRVKNTTIQRSVSTRERCRWLYSIVFTYWSTLKLEWIAHSGKPGSAQRSQRQPTMIPPVYVVVIAVMSAAVTRGNTDLWERRHPAKKLAGRRWFRRGLARGTRKEEAKDERGSQRGSQRGIRGRTCGNAF